MTVGNILATTGEIFFTVMIIIMFFNQDKLVSFEKKLAFLLKRWLKTTVIKIKKIKINRRIKKQNKINKKFIYIPPIPESSRTSDKAA